MGVGDEDWKIFRVNETYTQKALGSYNVGAYTTVMAKRRWSNQVGTLISLLFRNPLNYGSIASRCKRLFSSSL